MSKNRKMKVKQTHTHPCLSTFLRTFMLIKYFPAPSSELNPSPKPKPQPESNLKNHVSTLGPAKMSSLPQKMSSEC